MAIETWAALLRIHLCSFHLQTEPHLRRVYDMVAFEMGCAVDRLTKVCCKPSVLCPSCATAWLD